MNPWANKKCADEVSALPETTILQELQALDDWQYNNGHLSASFTFHDHYELIAFVNDISTISHTENHHPSIQFSFRDLSIEYWTHSVNGITENDFICASKVSLLFQAKKKP